MSLNNVNNSEGKDLLMFTEHTFKKITQKIKKFFFLEITYTILAYAIEGTYKK